MHHPTAFRLSALSLALFAAASQAQEATQLEAITIKSEGNANATAPVKDWRALERSTATDVKAALQDEPGVAFGGGNGTSQWTTIRSLGESNIDYNVDGTVSTSQIFHHQSRFMSDPALMKQIRVEKGTGAASAGIGVIGGSIKAETLDATDLLEDGQSAGARINGGVSSNKGYNGGFAVYGKGGQVDGIAIANWNTQKDYKAGDGRKSNTAASARAASSSRATTTLTTTTALHSASAAKNNTANATCAKNSPSAATATRRATATASPIPPTSPTKDAASAQLATSTATSSTSTTGKKPKAKPCASKRRASTSA